MDTPTELAESGNLALWEARHRRGWSQSTAAEALQLVALALGEPRPRVDARQIRWWEQGRHVPRPYYVRLLCLLYQLPPEELQLPPLPPGALAPLADDVKRRQFLLSSIGSVLSASSLPAWSESWERLAPALREPRLLDRRAVESFEQTLAILESLEPTLVSPSGMIGAVTGNLTGATKALEGSLPSALRRQLVSIVGESAALAGWLSWNLDDRAAAAGYLRTALEAANEAEDRQLGAYLVGCASCWLDAEPREKVARLRGAFGYSLDEASSWTKVWLRAKEADAAAAVGDANGALRALEQAQTAANSAGDRSDGRPRWHRWDQDWLVGEQGASLGRMGRFDEGQRLLQGSLLKVGEHRAKDRPWLLLAIARMHVRQEDPDPEASSQIAATVLAHASAIRSAPLLGEIRMLRRDLQPWASSSAIRRLDEQLAALA